MGMPLWKCVTTLSAFLVSCLQTTDVHGSNVMSIDIGTEWMRVVAFSSGTPTGTAFNEDSIGRIATAVAFDRGERQFGESALKSGVYYPADCFVYFLDLIGKTIDNPVVELYKKRFPQYNIVPHPERNTVLFKRSDSDEHLSPEELVAMLLEEAKDFARYLIKEDVNEAVISVPGYFGQAERTAMVVAAEMAGIEVLQLINSYTAAALNYGTLHADKFYKTAPVHIMIYNMDAYGTQASIVSYQLVDSEDETVTEVQPQLTVLGVGYERKLGGLEIQLRLRDYLASKFNSLQLTSDDVTKDPKSMARLFIEAGRLKTELSTNTDGLAQVNKLIDEKDMEIKVTREELVELCKDLYDQFVITALKAVESSGLTNELIEQVILVGTATEVPQLQDRLVKDLKLPKALNTDGAVVLGAAYKAADLSEVFKVDPFIIKDATLFPVQVTFDKEEIDDNKPVKQVKRILFGYMSPFPKHQFIIFNKHQRDIAFTVGYVELDHLNENEVRCLGSQSMGKFISKGVHEAYSKYQGQEAVDVKGIEACISINDSGILVLPKVKLLVEKTVTEDNTGSVSNSKNLKVVTVKEEIDTIDTEYFFVAPIQDDELDSSINKLKKLKEIDLAKTKKRKSLHKLLEAIYEVRMKLNEPEYASALTDTEMETILGKSKELSNWLAIGGIDSGVEDFDSKYDELNKLVTPVWTRILEHSERPLKLEALNNVLDSSNLFLEEIKVTTLDGAPFTQVDIDTFEKLIDEITKWRDNQIEKQEKLPKNVDPVLTIQAIEVIRTSLEGQLSKFSSFLLKIKDESNAKIPELPTDDEKEKMTEEQDSDTIVKTKASQDDKVEEFDENEEIITIEDDEDSVNQYKTAETKYFKPIVLTKTGRNEEL